MNTYAMNISYVTKTYETNNILIEDGKIPLHIPATSYEDARSKALEIAQGMSRAFNNTATRFFFRIIS